MKTIQIQSNSLYKNAKLIKALYRSYLNKDSSFHFLIEPELIIRTENKLSIDNITKYLNKKKIEYKVYDYPLAKEGYGEDEKSVVVRYCNNMTKIFHEISVLAIQTTEDDFIKIFERISHCALNMAFFDWVEEAAILSKLAYGRLSLEIRSDHKRFNGRLI